jgi:hypothetical protein
VEWLKVQTLSSNPSTTKKKKKAGTKEDCTGWKAREGAVGRSWSRFARRKTRLQDTLTRKAQTGQVLVAHTCNPSYSRGSDQEDHGSRDPISKNIQYKSELVMEWLKVKALSSSPHSAKIKRHKFRPW